jgi:integrative and conjugative element protein (TIGR02256 family)
MIEVKLFDYDISISATVVEILKKHIQEKKDAHESGGILLGQVAGSRIYVLRASIPTVFDKSTRYSFTRSKEIAQIIVNYEFENSGRKTIYLGEWHTHLEKVPSPSGQDKKMIAEQKKLGKLNENFILLFIQGTERLYIRMYNDKDMQELII